MENIFCLESHIHLCSRHTSAIPAYVIKTCLTWHAISGARYWGFVSPKLHVSTYIETNNIVGGSTRYLVFYNTSPPRMFLSLDLLWECRIQHGANGPLYVTSSYSTWIFCRGVSGFATDCPCGVWCRGLTTCLLHVGPPFGNRILNNSWAVGLT